MSSVEKAKALYGAFATGDAPTVLAGMDPGIRWSEAEGNPYQPSGVAWVGPQALVDNLFMKLATEWENFSVHPATSTTRATRPWSRPVYGEVPADGGRTGFPVLPRLHVRGRQARALSAVHRHRRVPEGIRTVGPR